MAKTGQDKTIYRKNKVTFRFTIVDEDVTGEPPLDITNFVLKFAIARLTESGSPVVGSPIIDLRSDTSGQIVKTDALNGEVEVRLTADDTDLLPHNKDYYLELESFDASNNPVVTTTGILTVLPNVSNV